MVTEGRECSEALSVSIWAAVTPPWAEGLRNNKCYFSKFGGLESPRCQERQVRAVFLLHDWRLLTVSSGGERVYIYLISLS